MRECGTEGSFGPWAEPRLSHPCLPRAPRAGAQCSPRSPSGLGWHSWYQDLLSLSLLWDFVYVCVGVGEVDRRLGFPLTREGVSNVGTGPSKKACRGCLSRSRWWGCGLPGGRKRRIDRKLGHPGPERPSPARGPPGEPGRALRSGGPRDPKGQSAQEGWARGARWRLGARTARAGVGPLVLEGCCLNVPGAACSRSGLMGRLPLGLVAQRVP